MTQITVHSITEQIPAEAIRNRFAVKDRSIRLARERGFFPASWRKGMFELCEEFEVPFSDDLFNWKEPDSDAA